MLTIPPDELLRAAVADREAQVRHLLTERAARRANGGDEAGRWRWRVEPGKEEAFEWLRGWFLRGQREAPVETTLAKQEPPERAPADRPVAARRPSWLRRGARLAGRGFVRTGRRLLEWGADAAAEEATWS